MDVNEISDDEITIDGYNVVMADRNRHGGGVLIYLYKLLRIELILEVTMNWKYVLIVC